VFKFGASQSLRSLGLLVLAAGLLGTVGVAAALWNRIEPTPPLTVTFLRLALAAPFLLAFAWGETGRNPLGLPRRDWPLILVMGGVMAACYSLFFLAIPLAGVTLAVVLSLCSTPVLVAVISIPLFGERLTQRIGLALGLGLVGTGILVGSGEAGPGPAAHTDYLWGAALALGSGGTYALFLLLSKLATRPSRVPGSQATALAFTLAAVLLLPVAALSGTLRLDLSFVTWLIALYMGLVPTALAYFLIQRALRAASATTASTVILLESAVAAFLAWALLGEPISLLTIGGAGLLGVSVWLLARPRRPVTPPLKTEAAVPLRR
jgi:DME family drug/metabolite transporter